MLAFELAWLKKKSDNTFMVPQDPFDGSQMSFFLIKLKINIKSNIEENIIYIYICIKIYKLPIAI